MGRLPSGFRLEQAEVILAEDDHHAVATNVVNWTNRELYHLFDDHRVLILGMSLSDPNIRRVLASIEPGSVPGQLRHWAVMLGVGPRQIRFPRLGQSSRARSAEAASAFRSLYWRDHGVEIIDIPDYESLLPFLVRLRYESFGSAAGDLWRQGSRLGYEAVSPWVPDRQRAAKLILDAAVEELRRDFAVTDTTEVVELGIFLLHPDGRTLELTFRGGADVHAVRGARAFSADPDHPEGLAGRVLVSGDLVRVTSDHPLHDYGLPERASGSLTRRYEGIISAPIISWQAGGVPIGVVYLTTSRTDGVLFRLPTRVEIGQDGKSLNDLYEWLSDLAMLVLSTGR
ncbi:MAG: SIR2 family protein [Dehalococcoidia bacterium]